MPQLQDNRLRSSRHTGREQPPWRALGIRHAPLANDDCAVLEYTKHKRRERFGCTMQLKRFRFKEEPSCSMATLTRMRVSM